MPQNEAAFEAVAEEELSRICAASSLREDLPHDIVQAMLGDMPYDLAKQFPAVVVLLGDTESRIAAKTILTITDKARRASASNALGQSSIVLH